MNAAIEWVALGVGTLGTVLWSLNKSQFTVSILWLISSLLWIWFAQLNGHYGLTARDGLGVVMYLVGIWTYYKNRSQSHAAVKAQKTSSDDAIAN